MKYVDAVNYIHSLERFGSRPGLERVTALLRFFGSPQEKLKCIHIAGTNGKGSVCAMSAKILQCAGYKVGLYISPFVVDFRERVQINGEYIPKRALASIVQQIIKTGITVTEFELITALAFIYFNNQKCDVVVLETGMGGRLDATNVITKPLACGICNISLDHTEVLGKTIPEITAEKCGIIKQNCPVVTAPFQPPQALKVIERHTNMLSAPADFQIISESLKGTAFLYKGREYFVSLAGRHQVVNAVTAMELVYKSGVRVSNTDIEKGLANTRHPARLEVIRETPPLILDGAHNPAGAKCLADTICGLNAVAILGIMADKDYDEVLKITAPCFSKIITVTVKENPRSLSAEKLKTAARRYCDNVQSADTYKKAIKIALAENKPIVVYGSLYLASAVRPLLLDVI